MAQTFRTRLRDETRDAHARVDQAFLAHDPTTFTGYIGFLAAHDMALARLASLSDLSPDTDHWIAADRTRIARDLSRLGVRWCALPPAARAPSRHPIAIEYILRGSKLGLRSIARQWQTAEDPGVRATCCFLNAPQPAGAWREFCDRLADMPAQGPTADTIIHDACHIFDLFISVARHPVLSSRAA